VPPLAWPVESRQFLLECFIEQVVPMMAQKDEQFCSPYPFDNLLFLLGEDNRRLPKAWLHRLLLAFTSDQLIAEYVHEVFGKLCGERQEAEVTAREINDIAPQLTRKDLVRLIRHLIMGVTPSCKHDPLSIS
jgi:hypothetical protein